VVRVLITGGAGFIGSNLAHRLIRQGHEVTIFDNLSRCGSHYNLEWLKETNGQNAFRLIKKNLTDFDALRQAAEGIECIYHLAGQVAVTASIQNPRQDFEDNALGTFNILEAARLAGGDPILIYSSTNKIYGNLEHVEMIEEPTRYRYAHLPWGISETMPLDFHSPYGCSKGTGDQYVHDYFRIYGLRTVIMRQSCVYGYRQFGAEDQGWLAWFIIAALCGQPITIFGDGKQLRDLLFIDDLLDVYEAAVQRIHVVAGQVYNIGGGPENTLSVWAEFGNLLEELLGHRVSVHYAGWRPGDQRVYVSDIRKASLELGWKPRISVRKGLTSLFRWIIDHRKLFTLTTN
jgi:CDP-paratose 2-epimerase